MNKGIIPIFFTVDNNYLPYLGVAITSLLKNASPDYIYKIYIINQGLSEDKKERLLTLKTDNSEINFRDMNYNLECITGSNGKYQLYWFTLAIFFRIFIPEMFPEYEKGIYLDSDIVVPGDISKLYNIDLEGNLIGGSVDKSVWNLKVITDYYKNASGIDQEHYINSGILLMDLKGLRKSKFAEKFLYLYDKYHFESICPDQDYINALCKDKIKLLDTTWNTMPVKNGKEVSNPNLIHYNFFQKPWHYKNIGYESYFWEYAKLSGFEKELKEIQANHTDLDKEKDQKCLTKMLENCQIISNSENTFKKVFESGKEKRL